MKNRFKILLSALCFTFFSCLTIADYNFSNINKALCVGDYEAVYEEISNPSGTMYTERDKVLEYLDKGIISHYAGQYQRSNKELAEAEKLMESYKAKSVTQAIGSMMVNDTVMDYAGDPYEDIYTNVFMALNYIQLGNHDDAFVEIRRIDNKLKTLSVKYQQEIEKNKLELKENAQSIPSVNMEFHNSALARYLSMLMYRSEGDYSNAQVDYNFIKQAFNLQQNTYNFKLPECISEDFCRQSPDARLNVVSLTGLAPVKKEEATPIFARDGFYRIALPVMVARDSVITGAEVTAFNTETGWSYTSKSEKIESVENIALDTYSEKYALIVAKTIGRMVTKLATTVALDTASREVDDSNLSLLFGIAGLVSKVNMFASERADVRTSRYLPKEVYVSGITVPEGSYEITVKYKNKERIIETRSYKDIKVKANELNLVESFCSR